MSSTRWGQFRGRELTAAAGRRSAGGDFFNKKKMTHYALFEFESFVVQVTTPRLKLHTFANPALGVNVFH